MDPFDDQRIYWMEAAKKAEKEKEQLTSAMKIIRTWVAVPSDDAERDRKCILNEIDKHLFNEEERDGM